MERYNFELIKIIRVHDPSQDLFYPTIVDINLQARVGISQCWTSRFKRHMTKMFQTPWYVDEDDIYIRKKN